MVRRDPRVAQEGFLEEVSKRRAQDGMWSVQCHSNLNSKDFSSYVREAT